MCAAAVPETGCHLPRSLSSHLLCSGFMRRRYEDTGNERAACSTDSACLCAVLQHAARRLRRVEATTEERSEEHTSIQSVDGLCYRADIFTYLFFSIDDAFEKVDFPFVFGELNNMSMCLQMGTASWDTHTKNNCFHANERQKSKKMQKMICN